jgi:hypothetical protein
MSNPVRFPESSQLSLFEEINDDLRPGVSPPVRCADCSKPEMGAMLRHDIWRQLTDEGERSLPAMHFFLCDACMNERARQRLGRMLRFDDLLPCSFNLCYRRPEGLSPSARAEWDEVAKLHPLNNDFAPLGRARTRARPSRRRSPSRTGVACRSAGTGKQPLRVLEHPARQSGRDKRRG